MVTSSPKKCCNSKPERSPTFNSKNASSKNNSHYKWFIRGMDCGACATKIEKALKALQGVHHVRIAFATERLFVEMSQSQTPSAVESIIKDLGYRLESIGMPIKNQPIWQTYTLFIILLGLTILASFMQYIVPTVGHYIFYMAATVGTAAFAKKAIVQIKNGTWFGIETLMSIAATGALFLEKPVEALLALLLFSLGEILEGFAGKKAKTGINNLMQLTPDMAITVKGNERFKVSVELLHPGEIIEVRPGDRLPVDGKVYGYSIFLNESALTGESIPVLREPGDNVMAGSLVVDQLTQITVTSEPGNNAIDRVITLIEEADKNKAPTARLIEVFSAWYTPLVIAMAVLVMVIPPLLLGSTLEPWLYKALTLLLIACPCALIISIPTAVTSALASAARFGVLVKGGATLEQLRFIKTLAFDKTGTLTEGKPKVTTIVPLNLPENQLLQLAASIERGSNHPLAQAIINEAENRQVNKKIATDIQVLAGLGVQGIINNQVIMAVSPKQVAHTLNTNELSKHIEKLESKGNTVVVIKDNHRILGLIGLTDTIRNDAMEAISQLKDIGINIIMLTGDNRRYTKSIASKLNIEYKAELLPEDKVKEIKKLKFETDGSVAMVGDGINDAPAMKAADVGIAMGRGSDIALETADAALTHERLKELATIIRLSKNTARIMRQNIILALGINLLFFITTLLGVTGLMGAVISDSGSTVLITLNALRLLNKNIYR